jgi:hypothetical protein
LVNDKNSEIRVIMETQAFTSCKKGLGNSKALKMKRLLLNSKPHY